MQFVDWTFPAYGGRAIPRSLRCSPGLAALQARAGPWKEHGVVVLTWGQPWLEDGTSTNQVQHAMGLVFLEGQLPRHHGMEDDPSGDPASSGRCPSQAHPWVLLGGPEVLTGSTDQPAHHCTSCS